MTTSQNGRAFNEWLRAQLKAKKMSQRQLAQQSGVDHSTISRLIRGDRMPSLGTATKLARGLRELREDADTAQYLGLVAAGAVNPTARVEYALRADDMLSEPQVRQIMEYYLAVRMRRFGRAFQPSEPSTILDDPAAGSPASALAADRFGTRRGRRRAGHAADHEPLDGTTDGPTGAALTPPPSTTSRARPGSPSTTGSRGQRTPASGAPAFAFVPRAFVASPGRTPRSTGPARLRSGRPGAGRTARPGHPRPGRRTAHRSPP